MTLVPSAQGATKVLSAEFLPLEDALLIFSDTEGRKTVSYVSLRNCREEERIILDGAVSRAVVSRYIPSFILTEGDELALYDRVSKKKEWSFKGFGKKATVLGQSSEGSFIAASDGFTAALFRFVKDKPQEVFKKEFSGEVAAVFPDTENDRFFAAEKTGEIAVWSFSGTLLKSVNIGVRIADMLPDEVLGKILIVSPSGLYSMKKDTLETEEVLKGPVTEAVIDRLSRRLSVSGGRGFQVYDYPSLRKRISVNESGNGIVSSEGGDFAGLIWRNFVKLYDLKLGAHIASIYVSDKGTFFYPPGENYGWGAGASFAEALSGGKSSAMGVPDQKKVCAPVAAMISGVYSPYILAEPTEVYEPRTAFPQIKDETRIKDPNGIEIPRVPSVSFPEMGTLPGVPAAPQPVAPKATVGIKESSSLEVPSPPPVKPIEDMFRGKVPSWVANRKNLPPFQAAASGESSARAFSEAKKSVKTAAVKAALKLLVNKKEVKDINDTEVKKRFLWAAAAAAVNSLDKNIMPADSWTSPGGQNFALAILDGNRIEKAAEFYYAKELKVFQTMTMEEYMKLPFDKIDDAP